ncbi:hypothetical protein KEG38_04925 [Polyangium jinanense]|uniref:hypothetical protein n=1 Tax=Polyangium jinanense TaxID=2829994 RepID=UPI0023405A64|nr:hypothetical protein [Polyangium jinanense]MDC3953173.1 hypothetical protein [Polyangium jinanense]
MPRKLSKRMVPPAPEPSEPAELTTELALASDGKLYFQFEDEPPPGRPVFVGYALHAEEVMKFNAADVLAWGMLHKLALGSDGCIYVEEGAIDAEGRDVFRGFAATAEEAARAAEVLHRAAFNITVEVFARKRAASDRAQL